MKINTKYDTKKSVKIIFTVLIFVGFLLTVGRWHSVFNNKFVVITAAINSHISNFSFSLISYTGIGYFWLLCGVKFRFIMFLGVFMIFANFVCESPLMAFMNTPDIVDAVYGTVGIAVSFVFLLVTNKQGLIPK